jgi:hypothetical protein
MRSHCFLAAGILALTLGFLSYSPVLVDYALAPPAQATDDAVPDLSDAPVIRVDWSKGKMQTVTLGGDRALTFTGGRPGGRYVLAITQDATGSRRVTWPLSVRWPGRGKAPGLTSTAGRTDYAGFIYNAKSNTYDGVSLSQNF